MKQLTFILFLLLILPSPIAAQERDDSHFPLPELEVISAENAARMTHLGTLEGFTDWVLHAAFNADGTLVAANGYSNVMRLWDVQTGELVASVECPERLDLSAMGGVVFIPNSLLVAAICNTDLVFWDVTQILDHEDSAPVRTLPLEEYAYNIVTDSEGRFIAVSDHVDKIWLGDIETGTALFSLEADGLCCINFSPDGRFFAYVDDSETHLFDLETLAETDVMPRSQAFNADWSLSADIDPETTQVRLRQVGDATPVVLENPARHYPSVLNFSPDGTLLASGSEDDEMVLWDTATDALSADIETCGISSMSFSPDGKLIVTTYASAGDGCDFSVALWGVPADEG